MAKKTHIELVDDIDGSKADETIAFSIDGAHYEIDLSAENAEKIRAEIGEWAEKGTRVARKKARRASAPSSSSEKNARIRQWAKDRGMDVADRGALPKTIIDEYEATHS